MVIIFFLQQTTTVKTRSRRAVINVALMIILHARQSVSQTALMSCLLGGLLLHLKRLTDYIIKSVWGKKTKAVRATSYVTSGITGEQNDSWFVFINKKNTYSQLKVCKTQPLSSHRVIWVYVARCQPLEFISDVFYIVSNPSAAPSSCCCRVSDWYWVYIGLLSAAPLSTTDCLHEIFAD